MTSGEITSLVVGIVTGTLPAVAAFILTLCHGDDIAKLQETTSEHNGRIAKLEPPPTPHKTHCSSTVHRALRVEQAMRKHHEPPKEK